MATLATESELLALACGRSAAFFDLRTKQTFLTRDDFKNTESGASSCSSVCSCLSGCGTLYAFCHGKRLSLVRIADQKVADSWDLPKSASRVRFLPDNSHIVVADKSGDVHVYPTQGDCRSGKLLLGHLSVLLDVLVTPNLRYVLTCDRDEKIRISDYPNSYNIHGYCLGHEEFVSSIDLVPHDPNTLLSCSGDGTVRFWDYSTCVQLAVHLCSEDLKRTDSPSSFALTYCSPMKLDSDASLLSILCSELSEILVYLVTGLGPTVKCTLKQIIATSAVPWHLACGGGRLWALLKDKSEYLASFDWNKNERIFERSSLAEEVMSAWVPYGMHLGLDAVFESELPIGALYKRKFDNVQEYLDKKMARLEGRTEATKKIKTEDRT